MKQKIAETVFSPQQQGENGRGTGKFTFPPESRPLEGYTIKRGIHRGGFGEVYYALSDAGKEVALKLLQQHMEIELRGISQCLNLKHANLVNLFDIRTDNDGDHWIVMEYVSGKALDQLLHEYPNGMPVQDVQSWINGMAEGLHFLHDRGIVHRDLKPANVFSEHGIVKIGDVGLSKFISESHRSAHTQSVGTVYYMAPEVAHGRYGREVDVYSLGIVLYELLTGNVPFEGESAGEILMKHLSEKPDLRPIPSHMRPVLARALEKDPLKRTPTVIDLRDDFNNAVAGRKVPDHTASDSFSAAAAAAAAAVGAAAAAAEAESGELEPFDVAGAKKFAAREARKAARHARRAARDARRMAQRAYHQYKQPGPPPIPKKGRYASAQQPAPVNQTASSPKPGSSSETTWWDQFPTWAKVLGIVVVVLALSGRLGGTGNAVVQLAIWGAVGYGIYCLICWFSGDNQNRDGAGTQSRDAGATPPPTDATAGAGVQAGAAYARYSKKRAKHINRLSAWRLTPDTPRSIPARERMTELTSSMAVAALCTALLTVGLFAFTSFFTLPAFTSAATLPGGPDPANAVFFGMTTLLGAWAVLGASKLWEGTHVDSTMRRLGLLIVGGLVGAAAFWMDSTLMVAMNDEIGVEGLFERVGNQTLVVQDGRSFEPTAAAYVLFFAGLFSVRRWWWQADSFRKRRFAIWPIIGTVVVAFVLTSIWEFPKAWALTWAAAISAVVHVSASWVPPDQRPRLVQEARMAA